MAVIHILNTGKKVESSAVLDKETKKGKLAYTGLFQKLESRVEIPVKAFYIEINDKKILVDTGWSSECKDNAKKHLGRAMWFATQPVVNEGEDVLSQLAQFGVAPEELDAVILTHLDCDHVSGLHLVKNAKAIYACKEELARAEKKSPRYNNDFWQNIDVAPLPMGYDSKAPFGKSCDLFGDGSVRAIYTPGHSAGSICVIIKDNDKLALFTGDTGYSEESWKELIVPGLFSNLQNLKISLRWVNKMHEREDCAGIFTSHDTAELENTITL